MKKKRSIAGCIKEFWPATILTPVFVIGEVVFDVLIPTMTGKLLDEGVEAGSMHHIALYGLTVENTEAHIQAEALPHLFEAFYRTESSRSRRTGGSGLGLYLVKMILDRHGAECSIENTEEGVRAAVRF